jgi:glycosyltransferase involved in cell wall biosynthesis
MAKPFVSVLIDTYNHESFIEQAIESVLGQDFAVSEREIIVVDDGSTDKTLEILRKYEPRIRVLPKSNGGQASAFNFAIPHCRGEIVSFLDGDDWWAQDKLTHVVNAMEANPNVGIVGHGIVTVQRDGVQRSEVLREHFQFQANSLAGAHLFRRRGAFLGTSRMTMRAELLRRIGHVPEQIKIQADEYLFTLACVLMVAYVLPCALTFYRMHDQNGFQVDTFNQTRLCRKQKSLAALDITLMQKFSELGIDPLVSRAALAYTHNSAAQLRLALDGGWPWETVATEWQLYRVVHPEAPLSHRMFKCMILMAALFAAPRSYYRAQRWLSQNAFYLRARKRLFPVPEMPHLQKDWRPHH